MKPEEKAKCGLWLLKEAMLDYLKVHPPGVSATEVRRALHLDQDSDHQGQNWYRISYGLYDLLEQEGKLEIRRGKEIHLFLPGQPNAKAASEK